MLLKSILLFALAIVWLFVVSVLLFGGKVSETIAWCVEHKWVIGAIAVVLTGLIVSVLFIFK